MRSGKTMHNSTLRYVWLTSIKALDLLLYLASLLWDWISSHILLRHQTKLFIRVPLVKYSHLSVTSNASVKRWARFLLQYQIMKRDFVDFFQFNALFMCKICKADTKDFETKNSGSNILYFDVNVAFYVFMCFSHSPLNSSLKVTFFLFQFTVLKVSMIFKLWF